MKGFTENTDRGSIIQSKDSRPAPKKGRLPKDMHEMCGASKIPRGFQSVQDFLGKEGPDFLGP